MLAQDLVAGLVVLAAFVYLVRRRLRSRGAACEGCAGGGCGTEAQPAASEAGSLVSIEGLHSRDS
jgi:hypothetical protein